MNLAEHDQEGGAFSSECPAFVPTAALPGRTSRAPHPGAGEAHLGPPRLPDRRCHAAVACGPVDQCLTELPDQGRERLHVQVYLTSVRVKRPGGS